MPHSFGYRARTRQMFSRNFREHGTLPLGTYLRVFKVGDYVDIKANGAIHKGMPHKFYHGRTGVVFNVTKTSVGVEVNKVVRSRVIKKRVHVRVEHVKPSGCRKEFLARVKANDAYKRDVKAGKAPRKPLKRQPAVPKGAYMLTPYTKVKTLYPLPYEILA